MKNVKYGIYFKDFGELERFIQKPFGEALDPKYGWSLDFKTSNLLFKQFYDRLFIAYVDKTKKENYPLFYSDDGTVIID